MRIFTFFRLLDDARVMGEIERYKWIESERAGKDIGRERAVMGWIQTYGHIWLQIHKPDEYKTLMDEDNADKQTACAIY